MAVLVQFYHKLRSRWGIPAVFVILLCITVLIVSFRESDTRRSLSFERGGSYIEGLKIIDRKTDSGKWIITAKRANFNRDETAAFLDAVTMHIEKENVQLSADKARYDMRTRELNLEENIRVVRDDTMITTNKISWDPAQRTLISGDSVQIAGKGFSVQGENLSAREGSGIIRMKNVKATLR